MKYARIERERRFFLVGDPPPFERIRLIEDRYLTGTTLRLRRVAGPEGIVYKLGQQHDLEPGVKKVTTIYLSESEFAVLSVLPGRSATKTRATVWAKGNEWAVDTYPDGTRIAETEADVVSLPSWIGEEITGRTDLSGASLAQ